MPWYCRVGLRLSRLRPGGGIVSAWPHKARRGRFRRPITQKTFGKLRQRRRRTRSERFDEIWRDEDEQLRICLVRAAGTEQVPDDWQIADPGKFGNLFCYTIIDETGNGETFAFVQFDFGFRSTRAYRRNQKTLNREGVREIERADFGLHLEMNQTIRFHCRGEIQPHAEWPELDRHYRCRGG